LALLASYLCAGIEFDIYDSERVPVGKSKYKYFVTPRRIDLIEHWMFENFVLHITKPEQMHELIEKNLIGTY
jgi:hypothetical protein